MGIDGSLNDNSDIDRGWQVEIALPWEGIKRFADGPLPPTAGDTLAIALARCQLIDQRASSFTTLWTPHPLPEGGLHKPETYPLLAFSASGPGA